VPKNPFTDVWQFLTATTDDYLALGGWRFVILTLFWILFLSGLALAFVNLRDNPEQRNVRSVGLAFVRIMIGCMWFEGMLWKLPLPASEGLRYWTEQEVTRAAFAVHGAFIKDIVLPNLALFGPLVFLAELTFAASLLLGFAVRAVSVLAIGFVLQLWLGIYRPGDPAEWPWSYMFLALLLFVFALEGAGRCLGLDAWLRQNIKDVREGRGLFGRALNLAS
jgi:uncharacterized membrane protein YphA (DoxX/SURF4 family)